MDHQQNVVMSSTLAGLGGASVALGFLAPQLERTVPLKAAGLQLLVVSGLIGITDIKQHPQTSDSGLQDRKLFSLAFSTASFQLYAAGALAINLRRSNLGSLLIIGGTVLMVPAWTAIMMLGEKYQQRGFQD